MPSVPVAVLGSFLIVVGVPMAGFTIGWLFFGRRFRELHWRIVVVYCAVAASVEIAQWAFGFRLPYWHFWAGLVSTTGGVYLAFGGAIGRLK